MAEVRSFCTYCGAKIEPNSKFCASCGKDTPLAAAATTTTTTAELRILDETLAMVVRSSALPVQRVLMLKKKQQEEEKEFQFCDEEEDENKDYEWDEEEQAW